MLPQPAWAVQLDGVFDQLGRILPKTLGVGEVDGRQIDALGLAGDHGRDRADRRGRRQVPSDGHRALVSLEQANGED